ncbi:hypothetical protein EDB80DRAFT_690291 [Ilyonectria destructans]|nr:hypothetical protein EDB80DRAFT_690291 [Ilyonectria destructans]
MGSFISREVRSIDVRRRTSRQSETFHPEGISTYRKCAMCRGRRSQKQHKVSSSILDQFICSRQQCMEFKDLLAASLHSRPVIIENHHHYHKTEPQLATPISLAELPGESLTVHTELPTYNAHVEYLAEVEDTPPAVDTSTKPLMEYMKGYVHL